MKGNIGNDSIVVSHKKAAFRTIQFLGSGGNCQVHLAMATQGIHRGVLFAIKFFTKIGDAERLKLFEQERDFLYEITHPAIMKIFDWGEYFEANEGITLPFVVAEYFPDRLDHRLSNKKLGLAEKLIYFMQLLSALKHLEEKDPQVVHRDIKPQNIFLKGYSCVLGDFGLMRDLDPSLKDEDDNFFKQSSGAGMPRFFRTPDLVKYAKHEASLTTKSDIYQLGLVAAVMFTGWNPLKPSKRDDLLDDLELNEIGTIPGGQGVLIKSLINKMLVEEPADRESLSQLLDQFDGVLRAITSRQMEIDGFVF